MNYYTGLYYYVVAYIQIIFTMGQFWQFITIQA